MIQTKIVVTLGPASSEVGTLERLLEEGADVCRLNFSHGDLASHGQTLANVREAVRRHGEPVGVLGDLAGPKIRLGAVAGEGMPIEAGERLVIQREPIVGSGGRVSSTYPRLVDEVSAGDRVLVEDGLLRFLVVEKTADEIVCTCKVGGVLKSAKGINLPDTQVAVAAVTERDWECVEWAIDNGVDYLGMSFVRRAEEIHRVRRRLVERGSVIKLIAKIEKAEAVERIEEILEAADGLMVARGDLGVEMDVAQVPVIQKDLVRRCQLAGKPVIVATQMLQSMIEQTSPTRAEVSDVANAIFDGANAVMLSGETAVGKYPAAAVHTMNHIAETIEPYLRTVGNRPGSMLQSKGMEVSSALAHAVVQLARDIPIRLVVVWSQTGSTARIFSKYHFPIPILALSDQASTLRQMSLNYGVMGLEMAAPSNAGKFVQQVEKLVREKKLAKESDRIALVPGTILGTTGTTDAIIVHTVGRSAV